MFWDAFKIREVGGVSCLEAKINALGFFAFSFKRAVLAMNVQCLETETQTNPAGPQIHCLEKVGYMQRTVQVWVGAPMHDFSTRMRTCPPHMLWGRRLLCVRRAPSAALWKAFMTSGSACCAKLVCQQWDPQRISE